MNANESPSPSAPDAAQQPAQSLLLAATGSKRNRLIALVAVLIAMAGSVLLYRHFSSPSGGELVLTAATDPGANAFMPPAASPPPTDAQAPPTLQPQGDGSTVETQPLPGDRDGLYGGTDNNAEVDRDKVVDFLGANPTQAGAFVEALNSDPTVWWSGARRLTVADIPTYLRELTPAVLRLDTRITNHGFDGTHPTSLQSVFQRGTALLVDAHGVPRVRGLSGSPLTAPVALRGEPKLVGTPWANYHPGALARVLPTTADIKNFVLVDVVTGKPFNRPVGTTGANDTPHTQPVAPPQPASTTPTPGQAPQSAPTTGKDPLSDIDGTYLWHITADPTYGCAGPGAEWPVTVTHQGNTVTIALSHGTLTGPLSADGSFSATGGSLTARGVFATDGGRTVIRDGALRNPSRCFPTFTGTRQ